MSNNDQPQYKEYVQTQRPIEEIQKDISMLTHEVTFPMENQLMFHRRFKEAMLNDKLTTSNEQYPFIILKERHYSYEHSLRAAECTLTMLKHEVTTKGLYHKNVHESKIMLDIVSLEQKIQGYLSKCRSTSCPTHVTHNDKVQDIESPSEVNVKDCRDQEYIYEQKHKSNIPN
ncbi:hypothetical protein BDA99DRAFT_561452 [Phascolomyces articulosus]|uniref:Uncharacterized protein n=1 Tax=Phascolomyces articulosus TaxID=60185 RepID=A0AAD5PC43_9FUNG|nr:hypothetical protein BDA99DRAFT_561452 [Phascolomyces articulosus]